jgi:hypothetical protein
MSRGKRTNGQTMIYKTLNRKLMIEQHEKPGVNSCDPEGLAVPTPHEDTLVTNPMISYE